MRVIKSVISGGYWAKWQEINAKQAVFHQWEQLELSGCIDNFLILAGGKTGFRQGWFFADSDAYKWLEAASSILGVNPDEKLRDLVDKFIALLQIAQDPDGYLYTYNQIHFPGTRWVNLQIEHELYCHGHLIEAGVTHFESTGEEHLLKIGRKAADRIVTDFFNKGPRSTPGHEEIEIALGRLYQTTGDKKYLAAAVRFLDQRGRDPFFAVNLLRAFIDNARRTSRVDKEKAAYQKTHYGQRLPNLPPENEAKKPPKIGLRFFLNALSGKFFQQHLPLEKQTVPVGHAVRFAYLATAAAMMDRLTGQKRYLPTLEQAWWHMVTRRMYITGGIGSLPVIEGFGKDYELDPAYAYAETCAALGCLFWNREMAQLTGEVQYRDLFEWQLYNAALVGMGQDGKSYFYNNPLAADGNVQRRYWYEVPCCPSNLSRTFTRLQEEVLSYQNSELKIGQYITSTHHFLEGSQQINIESQLPWVGMVTIKFIMPSEVVLALNLRQPSWATNMEIDLNGQNLRTVSRCTPTFFDPGRANWITIDRRWANGDRLEINFDLPVQIYYADKAVKALRGKGALVCGPLVYCLESVDNPGADLFNVVVDPATLESEFTQDVLGGVRLIHAKTTLGEALTFIPYHLWGNRGRSSMVVFTEIGFP